MSDNDNSQERSQEASAQRKEKARKKGQIPRSRELTTFAMMLASITGCIALGPRIIGQMEASMQAGMQVSRDKLNHTGYTLHALTDALGGALWSLLGLFALLFVIALTAPVLLGGFNFSGESITPKWSRIDPLSGLKRIISINGLLELVKAILKMSLIIAVIYLAVEGRLDRFLIIGRENFQVAMHELTHLVETTLLWVLLPLGLIAILDAPAQWYQNNQKLRMTRKEVRDEFKENEGSPEMKNKRRQTMADMSQQRMMGKVADSDIVITNPTHYAVALRYDPDTMEAPILVAKGEDFIAAQIRKVATENGVHILQAPALCRALHFSTELEQAIPAGLYITVAHVLSYVMRLREMGAARAGRFNLNDLPPIPPELQHD